MLGTVELQESNAKDRSIGERRGPKPICSDQRVRFHEDSISAGLHSSSPYAKSSNCHPVDRQHPVAASIGRVGLGIRFACMPQTGSVISLSIEDGFFPVLGNR